ncbi:CopG family ribbon-helix-helix protein [candidate division CSSED10-310 bacterium]|uniref:CopG family ribbon-helix-helix protein n=1 Tax=candidate division CSSED10-310 bacterium TaxID=2855610 RepID=A0ABV6Z0V0_UNCC1
MAKTKIAISVDVSILNELDFYVKNHKFINRSQAIQRAIEEILEKMKKNRLAEESAKLDPDFEKALAEEGLSQDVEAWPEY